jgi:3-hydroxyisobutyrate dehydrogenase-like beta-hydroxyacid dehydrogenase
MNVAFMGLGIMGFPMARNLAEAGFELSVWTRDSAKAERFAEEHGARAAATPAEAANGAAVAISMVPDSPQVEAVLLGEDGAAAGLDSGDLCIDMSTIAPTATRAIAERLAQADIDFLDAPVTGSRPKAEDATLTIMVGGEREAFERATPLFEAMGELVVHVGPQGHGEMAKLINNVLAAVNAAALAEGLELARAAGVDTDSLRRVVAAGAGGSTMLELKAQPMLDGDFEALFKLEHMLKDVRHCLAEARALGLELPLASLTEGLYAAAAEGGHAEDDFAAVMTVVRCSPDQRSGSAPPRR